MKGALSSLSTIARHSTTSCLRAGVAAPDALVIACGIEPMGWVCYDSCAQLDLHAPVLEEVADDNAHPR